MDLKCPCSQYATSRGKIREVRLVFGSFGHVEGILCAAGRSATSLDSHSDQVIMEMCRNSWATLLQAIITVHLQEYMETYILTFAKYMHKDDLS